VTSADNRAWLEARFDEVVGNPVMRARVHAHISQMAEPDDPGVAISDIVAARHYLRKCMERTSVNELAEKSDDELASLWARGAMGAARYRARHRLPRRGRSRATDEDEPRR